MWGSVLTGPSEDIFELKGILFLMVIEVFIGPIKRQIVNQRKSLSSVRLPFPLLPDCSLKNTFMPVHLIPYFADINFLT
jgi:hypothetical protein